MQNFEYIRNGNERKGKAVENILMLAIMSGGEVLGNVARNICRSDKYYIKIIGAMKQKEEGCICIGTKPRTVIIKRNGIERMKNYFLDYEKISNSQMRLYNEEKSRRRAAISQSLYNAQLAGIKLYPKEKEPLYEYTQSGEIIRNDREEYACYSPMEMKENQRQSLRGSKIHSLIIGKGRILCTYNVLNSNAKILKGIEQNAYTYLEAHIKVQSKIEKIFFYDKDFLIFDKISDNDRVNSIYKNQETKTGLQKITTDIPNAYIIPNNEPIYFDLILYPDIVSKMKAKLESREKERIIVALPLTLTCIRMIRTEITEVTVLCMDEQKEIIKKINPNVRVITVKKSELGEKLKILKK